MSLKKYIGYGESIKFKFGISKFYLLVKLGFLGGILFFLSYFYRENPFFAYPPIAIFGLITFYELAVFFATDYFVTEKKIYKKTGVLWKKVIEVTKEEVTDVSVIRGFLDKIIFFTGTLEINTAGSTEVEIVLTKVNNPYKAKKNISQAWNE